MAPFIPISSGFLKSSTSAPGRKRWQNTSGLESFSWALPKTPIPRRNKHDFIGLSACLVFKKGVSGSAQLNPEGVRSAWASGTLRGFLPMPDPELMLWLFDRQQQHDGDGVCSDREFRQDRYQRHPRHVEANAGGTPMTSAIARKVLQAFKQPATFTTTFEPVKLEMVRKM